jgi:hydroxylamine reductase
MTKWKCAACDYVYNPEKGDPDNEVPPGTKFEDIPDTWECPVCKDLLDQFEKMQ